MASENEFSGKSEHTPDFSEAIISSIIDNYPYAMVYQILRRPDGTRKLLYVSNSVKRFYGITPKEAMADIGLIYGKVHLDDRSMLHEAEERANAALQAFKCETKMMDPSGGIRWSYFISNPTKLEDGSTRWDGIEFDITDNKQNEERIRNSEVFFRTIFEGNRDAIYIADADTGLLIDVNETGLSLVGRTREELIGKDHNILHPPNEAEFYGIQFKRHVEAKYVNPEESHIITSKGKVVPVEISASTALLPNGKTIIIGNFRNIAERKIIEDELKEKIRDLEIFNKATMGREERILELKEKVKSLEAKLKAK